MCKVSFAIVLLTSFRVLPLVAPYYTDSEDFLDKSPTAFRLPHSAVRSSNLFNFRNDKRHTFDTQPDDDEEREGNDRSLNTNTQDTCTQSRHAMIKNAMNAVSCRHPEMTTIRLDRPGPNYENTVSRPQDFGMLLPSVVKVKRCSGHCANHKECIPIKKSPVVIPVYQLDKTSRGSITCTEYMLEHHEECRCGCSVEAHHCTIKQKYVASRCSCECANYDEQDACSQAAITEDNRYWDNATCTCQCKPMGCPRGFVWTSSNCGCSRVKSNEKRDL